MSQPKKSPIIVLGADGYLGWPLSLRLARKNPEREIVLVDNFLRRRLVRDVGSDSILPVLEIEQRLWACKKLYNLSNMNFVQLDVNSPALDVLIADQRPVAIYHLAQQCSAPFSMKSAENALLTLRNNEEGNMRLLWSVREHVPNCHIIKLGTFGEYAKGGLDIAEGYFQPEYHGRKASLAVPYPRQADDIYHASKINDTNYIALACHKWGLRVTDIMQSTVFGTWTEDIGDHRDLFTRVDYDEYFGTVANRFIAQALRGLPLTVYGTGHQRTGLMSLNDSISSLASLWNEPPDSGTHRVINHVTEKSFSVNELADSICEIAKAESCPVTVQRGVYDPRGEQVESKLEYEIESQYLDTHMTQSDMQDVVHKSFRMLLPYRARIRRELFAPHTQWCVNSCSDSNGESVVVPLLTSRISRNLDAVQKTEQDWEAFRREHFPYDNINLNPGTMGSPSETVMADMRQFHSRELLAQPLLQYGRGREVYYQARREASQVWPAPDHELQLVGGASQCSNLLALSFARLSARANRPLRVLTTLSEHIGGIGAFERIPEFRVCYISEKEIKSPEAFAALIEGFKPDIAFFSHIAYDSGHRLPVADWMRELKKRRREVCTILDVSQSLGVLTPEFENADVVFGSCHKWLFGPRGTGLMWTNENFRDRVGALNWSGEPLSKLSSDIGFAPSGGLDFSCYAGLATCIRMHRQLGPDNIRERSAKLALFFRVRLTNLLKSHGVRFRLLEPHDGKLGVNGMFSVNFLNYDPYPLYDAMNQKKVHCKCIKGRGRDGKERSLLRFGIPYYETEARLQKALSVMEDCLRSSLSTASNHGLRYLANSDPQSTLRSGTQPAL